MCRTVVVGDPSDPHVEAVLEHLPRPGTVIVDAASVSRVLVRWDQDGWLLRDATGEPTRVSNSTTTRGWIRRYGPPDWDEGVLIGSHRAAVLTARLTLLGALMRDARIEWLTTSDRLAAAENKLVQYDAADALAIRTPTTVISADLSSVVAAVGEPFVCKPLGVAHFEDAGATKIVYAEQVTAADLDGVEILEAPFLMQRLIDADTHLRVVTVHDHAWVCEQPAADLPVDWRRADEAHDSFRATRDRPHVAEHAVALAQAMGVAYSSQDWLVLAEETYFLDLNPAGQWAFLPDEVSRPITTSIAAWLNQEDRRK